MTDTLFEYDHLLMRSEYRMPDIHSPLMPMLFLLHPMCRTQFIPILQKCLCFCSIRLVHTQVRFVACI